LARLQTISRLRQEGYNEPKERNERQWFIVMREFERKLAESWPPADWRDMSVLVAVSGGADSVALICAMAALRSLSPGRLIVAHVNHQLRGGEAAADERFVLELSHRLELPCEVGREPVAERAALAGDGLEAAARAARYQFFRETAERLGARQVATAHTADDQAETILHRVLRGTGLSGLAGVRRVRPLGPAVTMFRPLLAMRRADVLNYLDDLGQPYRDDATNFDTRFTRNRLRHELLPRLASDFNPQVVDALVRLGRLAGEAQQVVASLVEPLVERCVRPAPCREIAKHGPSMVAPSGVTIDCRPLEAQPRYVVRELLIAVWRGHGFPEQAMGFDHWEQLAQLALAEERAPAVKTIFPGGIVARRSRDTLTLKAAGDEKKPRE
jgi:tRNA(Ile)-lysidine synthase